MGSPDASDYSFIEFSLLPKHEGVRAAGRDRLDVDFSAFDPNDTLALAKWKTPGTITEMGGRAVIKAATEDESPEQAATA